MNWRLTESRAAALLWHNGIVLGAVNRSANFAIGWIYAERSPLSIDSHPMRFIGAYPSPKAAASNIEYIAKHIIETGRFPSKTTI